MKSGRDVCVTSLLTLPSTEKLFDYVFMMKTGTVYSIHPCGLIQWQYLFGISNPEPRVTKRRRLSVTDQAEDQAAMITEDVVNSDDNDDTILEDNYTHTYDGEQN